MDHPIETKEEARQGERRGWVTRVLVISTVLAAVLMVASYFIAGSI